MEAETLLAIKNQAGTNLPPALYFRAEGTDLLRNERAKA